PEIVRPGETGLLVPSGDVDALTEALASLLESPARRREIGARAAEYAHANFSSRKAAEQVMEIYREILPARDSRQF
ncbi:glycosyltransferase, partial [bacterium]|nr:glycosyltransferase [bacterium]